MPKKSSAAAGKSGANASEFKQEEVLQAVLLADSFAVKLRPLTKEKPKVRAPPPVFGRRPLFDGIP
jgi:hypothetical protein